MPNELKCPKCGADMKQGYVLELGEAPLLSVSQWIAGPPDKLNKEQFPIESFRCVRCGYLESYALPPPSSAT
jgi:predicted nucleic-acid-binding Zn-ribbon protein